MILMSNQDQISLYETELSELRETLEEMKRKEKTQNSYENAFDNLKLGRFTYFNDIQELERANIEKNQLQSLLKMYENQSKDSTEM